MTGGGDIWHLRRRHEIDSAHSGRIKRQACGYHVHQPLMGKHRGHHAHAAIWTLGACVCRDRVRLVLVVADVVWTRDQAHTRNGVEKWTEWSNPISPDVGVHGRAKSEHSAVVAHGGAEPDALVAGVVGRLKVFRPGLDPFHRAGRHPRDPGHQDLLRVDLRLDAKASTDVGGYDPDLPRFEGQGLADRIRDEMRDLGRAPDDDAARAVGRRHHAAPLDRSR